MEGAGVVKGAEGEQTVAASALLGFTEDVGVDAGAQAEEGGELALESGRAALACSWRGVRPSRIISRK